MSRLVKRESTKEASVANEKRIFQLRYALKDWDGSHFSEAEMFAQKSPKTFDRIAAAACRKVSSHFKLDIFQHPSRKRKMLQNDASRLETSDISDDDRPQGPEDYAFAFIRTPGCKYLKPL